MRKFELDFEGYFISKDTLPGYGGIYLVYKGSYDPKTDRVSLDELVYVGEAGNIKDRHTKGHEHDKDFQNIIKGVVYGCVIYATAKLENEDDRKRVENAIIYHEQPDINTDGRDSFNFPKTQVISTGMCKLMDANFTEE